MSMSDAYLELRNVSKRFSGVQALDQISLAIIWDELEPTLGRAESLATG